MNRAAYAAGRLVGAALLSRETAEQALTEALDSWTFQAPSDRARMLRTLHNALADGERNPRTPQPREERRAAPGQ